VPRAIIVHGGAGLYDASRVPRCREGCEAAARAGWAVLERGGAALDAVEEAVYALEDDPEFNAGYGAVLNRNGEVEVDAALMETGLTSPRLRAGGVGAVPWMRHPIRVARRVLEDGAHLLLVGEGALAFGHEHGLHPERSDNMVAPRARERWIRERAGSLPPSATGDTVGAVAFDGAGFVGAASSTGGISGKRPGRVGDSPIPGAGLYALADVGRAAAATATGHGESILRALMSKLAVDAMLAGATPDEAARVSVERMAALTGGTAGIVCVDALGRVGQSRNTPFMPWAAVVDGHLESGA
jgi:beta-aspartyl-peptidase (threonine type)